VYKLKVTIRHCHSIIRGADYRSRIFVKLHYRSRFAAGTAPIDLCLQPGNSVWSIQKYKPARAQG